VDKDDISDSGSNPAPNSFYASIWNQPKWVDFGFAYLGTTYTKADATSDSYFLTYDIPNDSALYPEYGRFVGQISASRSDGKSLLAQASSNGKSPSGQTSATGYYGYGYVDGNYTPSFTLTPRAVPVPGFAFGIVAAGGWLASKQLRRKTQTAKQSVSA
ncbi:MAG: hypothetical protein WCQ26_12560, partial [Pseudanabaena sp. ELA748]